MRIPETLQSMLDRLAAFCALVLLSPVLAVAAAAILIEDGRPVLFRQKRIGRHGAPFLCLKLRSMRTGSAGPRITQSGDPRITRVGRVLRAYKLDELPQLINVLKGEMSLIGPRPEVPMYVDTHDPLWQVVLSVRPGISDLATLVYRNEERLLATVENPEAYYRGELLPRKLRLSAHYIHNRSVVRDLTLLALTARYSLVSAGFQPEAVLRTLSLTETA